MDLDFPSFMVGLFTGIITTGTLLFFFWMVTKPMRYWFQSFMSGAPLSMLSIVGMIFRGSPVDLLVKANIALAQSGHRLRMAQIESHYLANQMKIITLDDLVSSLKEQHLSDSPS